MDAVLAVVLILFPFVVGGAAILFAIYERKEIRADAPAEQKIHWSKGYDAAGEGQSLHNVPKHLLTAQGRRYAKFKWLCLCLVLGYVLMFLIFGKTDLN